MTIGRNIIGPPMPLLADFGAVSFNGASQVMFLSSQISSDPCLRSAAV